MLQSVCQVALTVRLDSGSSSQCSAFGRANPSMSGTNLTFRSNSMAASPEAAACSHGSVSRNSVLASAALHVKGREAVWDFNQYDGRRVSGCRMLPE